MVPDRVSDIFMAAYSQLQGPGHKLDFFKLLVNEFGVQRECAGCCPSVLVMLSCLRAGQGMVVARRIPNFPC